MSIEKEFIPYEEALALKELGFDEPCLSYWDDDKVFELNPEFHKGSEMDSTWLTRPTLSQAFRWFRQQFDWQHSIEPTADQHSHNLGYNYWIWNYNTREEHYTMPKNRPTGDWEFVTYEETELACLKKLIEIVKEGNK
jgi:hypothetical protein